MSSLTLNERDHELLHALVRKVRVFTQRQIAEHWWQADLANARRRLKQLAEAGLVARVTVHARPLPELAQPVIVWRPGQPAPDFGQAAYQLQRRWAGKALRAATAYIATQAAAQMLGGKHRGEIHQPTQVTHDLGVAAVWMQLHRTAPQWAEAWHSEDFSFWLTRDAVAELVRVRSIGSQFRARPKSHDFGYGTLALWPSSSSAVLTTPSESVSFMKTACLVLFPISCSVRFRSCVSWELGCRCRRNRNCNGRVAMESQPTTNEFPISFGEPRS